MLNRRSLLAVSGAALVALAVPAEAAERVPFEQAAFDAALKSGRPVLIDVSASWCLTCKAQKTVLTRLTAKPEFAAFTIFEVDYDTRKDVMQSFGVRDRSTLIVFKGGSEVDRLSWETSEAAIAALLSKAL